MRDDRFRPDAAVRRVSPMSGNRADRIVIDDPRPTATKAELAAAMARFRDAFRARMIADANGKGGA